MESTVVICKEYRKLFKVHGDGIAAHHLDHESLAHSFNAWRALKQWASVPFAKVDITIKNMLH